MTIKRSNVKDVYVKQVIIRLDYNGVSNEEKIISSLNDNKCFDSSWSAGWSYHNDIKIRSSYRQDDFEQISKSLSIPVEQIEKNIFFRYEKKVAGIKVVFDVSRYYLCLNLLCDKNYTGLDEYIDLFSKVKNTVFGKEPFANPKRFGIRKIREQDFNQIEDVFKVFRKNCFPGNPVKGLENIASEYTDVKKDDLCGFRLKRKIYSIRYIDRRSNSIVDKKIQTILDIDSYVDDVEVLKKKGMLDLLKLVNNREFDLYKSFMTTNFLNGKK